MQYVVKCVVYSKRAVSFFGARAMLNSQMNHSFESILFKDVGRTMMSMGRTV